MNLVTKLRQEKTPLMLCAGILFIVSLLFPASREMHGLCLRLFFHWGGTQVQGQVPGCVIRSLPTVSFSEKRQQELRKRSALSPEDFVLATSTGNYFNLNLPPASAWKDHSLLNWAALWVTWLSFNQQAMLNLTNSISGNTDPLPHAKVAWEIVQLAQTTDPSNGALWLAEAMLDFRENQDEAALNHLRMAADKGHWDATTQTTFAYTSSVLEKAGLSKLDAVIQANAQLPDVFSLTAGIAVKRQLDRLLIEAVEKQDDQRFSNLLELMTELQKPDWKDKSVYLRNNFRNFSGSTNLINAMAMSMGRSVLSDVDFSNPAKFEENERFRRELFDDYLRLHAEPKLTERFFEQQAAAQVEARAIHDKRETQEHLLLASEFRSTLASTLALLMFALVLVATLFELPFAWLRRNSSAPVALPKQASFWLLALLAMILSVLVFTNFFAAIGAYNAVGFGATESLPVNSPWIKAVRDSFAISAVWLVALLCLCRINKKPVESWWTILIFANAYCLCIFVAACLRHQVVEKIAANL